MLGGGEKKQNIFVTATRGSEFGLRLLRKMIFRGLFYIRNPCLFLNYRRDWKHHRVKLIDSSLETVENFNAIGKNWSIFFVNALWIYSTTRYNSANTSFIFCPNFVAFMVICFTTLYWQQSTSQSSKKVTDWPGFHVGINDCCAPLAS